MSKCTFAVRITATGVPLSSAITRARPEGPLAGERQPQGVDPQSREPRAVLAPGAGTLGPRTGRRVVVGRVTVVMMPDPRPGASRVAGPRYRPPMEAGAPRGACATTGSGAGAAAPCSNSRATVARLGSGSKAVAISVTTPHAAM